MIAKIVDTVTSAKTKFTEFMSERGTKACLTVTTAMLSAGAMSVPVSAEGSASSVSIDTVFDYGKKALDFCLSNDVTATIFYCSVAGAIFGVVYHARRAVH